MAPADFHRADAGNSASKAHEFLKIQAKNPRALRSELELLVLVSMTSVFFEVFFQGSKYLRSMATLVFDWGGSVASQEVCFIYDYQVSKFRWFSDPGSGFHAYSRSKYQVATILLLPTYSGHLTSVTENREIYGSSPVMGIPICSTGKATNRARALPLLCCLQQHHLDHIIKRRVMFVSVIRKYINIHIHIYIYASLYHVICPFTPCSFCSSWFPHEKSGCTMVYRSVDQERLLQQGVPLEDRSFTFVINSCGRSALWRDAMQVFKMCTPNVIIYNAAIAAVTMQWLV